jgi:hypothetical protein
VTLDQQDLDVARAPIAEEHERGGRGGNRGLSHL